MEAKDLKAIIEQVLQEMNVSSDEKAAPEATAAPAPAAEWTCECGQVNKGKFCSNCGKARD